MGNGPKNWPLYYHNLNYMNRLFITIFFFWFIHISHHFMPIQMNKRTQCLQKAFYTFHKPWIPAIPSLGVKSASRFLSKILFIAYYKHRKVFSFVFCLLLTWTFVIWFRYIHDSRIKMNIILVLDATFVFRFFFCFLYSTIELNVNFSFYFLYGQNLCFVVGMMVFLRFLLSMIPWSSKEMELTKKTKHQRLNLDDEVSDFNDIVYILSKPGNILRSHSPTWRTKEMFQLRIKFTFPLFFLANSLSISSSFCFRCCHMQGNHLPNDDTNEDGMLNKNGRLYKAHDSDDDDDANNLSSDASSLIVHSQRSDQHIAISTPNPILLSSIVLLFVFDILLLPVLSICKQRMLRRLFRRFFL